MKSYFLEGLNDYDRVRAALSDRLPHWVEPWRLNDQSGDAIAFLTLEEHDDGAVLIQADLSGRHHDKAESVIDVLYVLRNTLGGQVIDDDDNIL